MNNATDNEVIYDHPVEYSYFFSIAADDAYDMDGVCVCKLEGCAFCNPSHRCAGDNCYCIGGDENFDLDLSFEPW